VPEVDDAARNASARPGVIADVRFFTIADADYYLGLVALVNSLRFHGHTDPITVLDLGLTEAQRSEISAECDLVRLPPGAPDNPWLLHPLVCQTRLAKTTVYIDSDIIVTSPLDEILATAGRGAICVFADYLEDRWSAAWEEIFGLGVPPRRQPYVNAGFLAFSTDHFPSFLERWTECCKRITHDAGVASDVDLASPTGLASQDALNALLMSEVGAERVSVQPSRTLAQGAWQLAKTRVVDGKLLDCQRDGVSTMLLHSWGNPKPWQAAAGPDLRRTAYLLCLRRLLNGDDVAVRSSQPRVRWLAAGVRGTCALRSRTSRSSARLHARGLRVRVRRVVTGSR
jgi:hypothetical protein